MGKENVIMVDMGVCVVHSIVILVTIKKSQIVLVLYYVLSFISAIKVSTSAASLFFRLTFFVIANQRVSSPCQISPLARASYTYFIYHLLAASNLNIDRCIFSTIDSQISLLNEIIAVISRLLKIQKP